MQNKLNEKAMYEHIYDWLKDYHSTDDYNVKAKSKALIVSRMLPIVRRIAHTIARRSYDPIDDLVQAGSMGLLKAIDSFSSDDYMSFKYYAGSLIIGEMKHYIRDKINMVKVPRHIQELSYRINSFISTLTAQELNDLTSEYVAQALDVSSQEVDFVMMTDRRKVTVSLDDFEARENSLGYEQLISSKNSKEQEDLNDARLIIDLVIVRLPKEYRKLVELYYYQDLSKAAIAKKLNMSQMQVTRKLQKAFELLHEMISDSQLGNSLMEIF